MTTLLYLRKATENDCYDSETTILISKTKEAPTKFKDEELAFKGSYQLLFGMKGSHICTES